MSIISQKSYSEDQKKLKLISSGQMEAVALRGGRCSANIKIGSLSNVFSASTLSKILMFSLHTFFYLNLELSIGLSLWVAKFLLLKD